MSSGCGWPRNAEDRNAGNEGVRFAENHEGGKGQPAFFAASSSQPAAAIKVSYGQKKGALEGKLAEDFQPLDNNPCFWVRFLESSANVGVRGWMDHQPLGIQPATLLPPPQSVG